MNREASALMRGTDRVCSSAENAPHKWADRGGREEKEGKETIENVEGRGKSERGMDCGTGWLKRFST